MKRHHALAHLSREHHGALILARLLQRNAPAYRGLPTDTEGKISYALHSYNTDLIKHFEAEEKVFNLVAGRHAGLDSMASIIIKEHLLLHQLFTALNNQPVSTKQLDDLGKLLEMHIRKEERELFPLIEESCSNDIMLAIDRLLTGQEV